MEEIDVKFPVGEDGERIDGDTLDKVDNKKIRFALYRAFTYQRYGFLGKAIEFSWALVWKIKSKNCFQVKTMPMLVFDQVLSNN